MTRPARLAAAAVRLVRVPPGGDAPAAVAAALPPPPPGFGHTLWLVPTATHTAGLTAGSRPPLASIITPHFLTLQAFADELVAAGDPHARPLTEPLRRLLADLDDPDRKRAKLHLLTPGERLARAAGLWAAGERGRFAAARRVGVVGFTTFTESERALLAALAESVDDIAVSLVDDPGSRPEVFAAVRDAAALAESLRGEPDLFTPPADTPAPVADHPPGLRHLAASLFAARPPAADASGVTVIEAPGPVGEARLVARAVRQLLAGGADPESVVVTARHPNRVADVLREVFAEYALPAAFPDPPPRSAAPAVRALLAAWHLPDDDFPFPAVAALLRHTRFRPPWPEVRDDPELPLRAEALLRQIGGERGKELYLSAAAAWAESPPLPLEDETAEEPRRKRLHELAVRCRSFLRRFFALWDGVPRTATPAAFAARLKRLAADTGLSPDPALAALFADLDRWADTDWPAVNTRKTVPRAAFGRMLAALASAPQSLPPSTGVRVLPPAAARGADCDHLFIVNLGEGSFPDLADAADPAAALAAESHLFLELAARPRRSLTLSYAAVDAKGQPLLPSSFLQSVRACFTDLPTTRQRMTIEGYAREPLSDAEVRVAAARLLSDPRSAGDDTPLSANLRANLVAARTAAAARFRDRAFGPFDGLLRHPAVAADLGNRLGPAKVFSPTALEAYVACPFRFWAEHVLRLEPLDDPGEEVEHTRRGAAVHRALARFHAGVPADRLAAELPDDLGADLEAHLMRAVEEYAARSAGPAVKVLWRLEGKRLLRAVGRYRRHWEAFRGPWREKKAGPVPHSFEADFGVPPAPGGTAADALVIEVGGVEVRVGGRIDRVDVAEVAGGLGFWVIDYKTGRGQHYTAAALERFEKLQLPLYALAVERVLLPNREARPLGLAYWMVAADGPKPVLPGKKKELLSWLSDGGKWAAFRTQLEAWVATLAGHIRAGSFPLAPRSEDCTDTCGLGPVCRIGQSRAACKLWPLELPGRKAGDE